MMKLLPFILMLAVLGCKKSDDVAPSPVGVYQMHTENTFTNNGVVSNQAGNGSLSIVKLNDDLYELTEDYSGYYRKFRARINGRTLTVATGNTETVQLGNYSYMGVIDGSGNMNADGNSLSISTVTNVGLTGLTFKKQSLITARR